MKTKIYIPLLLIISALAVSACAPSAPNQPLPTEQPVSTTSTSLPQATEAAAPAVAIAEPANTDRVSFSKDVWPILEKYALAAHGGKGGVFLESYEDVSKYVVPGKPEESLLYKSLIGDGVKRMPPDAPLADELIKTIYDWISQGANKN